MSERPYRNPYLSGLRASIFGASLVEIAAGFAMRSLPLGRGGPLTARAPPGWLHAAKRSVLRRIGVDVAANGDPPLEGLVVSNHLSYMDVLAYSSLFPCLFVSKDDVKAWPVFGRFATMAGTIYIERDRNANNRNATSLMEQALHARVPVVLFPEGTSSNGDAMLPFRSPFFEPAIKTGATVTASAIAYESTTARESELAYYGDDVFGPHLLRTLGQRAVCVRVAFAGAGQRYNDRKQAARATQAEVEALRAAVSVQHKGCNLQAAQRLTRAG